VLSVDVDEVTLVVVVLGSDVVVLVSNVVDVVVLVLVFVLVL